MHGVHTFDQTQPQRSCLEPYYLHRTEVPPDTGGNVTFKWHWPRGVLSKRMSALEICEFILPHMPSIVPLFADHKRVQAEFQAMLVVLATSPKSAIDRLLPWVKPRIGTEEDDLIFMQIDCREPQPIGPTYFT